MKRSHRTDAHEANVRRLFADPRRYLAKDFNVALRQELVRELVGSARGLQVVDLGCGDGRISSQFLPECAGLTWVDASEGMLSEARRGLDEIAAGKVTWYHGDALSFAPARAFDLVLALGLLAHMRPLATAIDKLAQLVIPHGRVILQLTDADSIVSKALRAFYLAKLQLSGGRDYVPLPTSHAEIRMLAERCGLRVVAERRYWTALPGLGRLPNEWLYQLQAYTARAPWLAARGPERIVMFERA